MKIADDLLKPYWIDVDNHNHTVQQEVMSKDFKVSIKNLGYFSNVGSAVNFIAKLKVREANPTHPITLKQYVSEMKAIEQTFLKTLN